MSSPRSMTNYSKSPFSVKVVFYQDMLCVYDPMQKNYTIV